jgi:hypothetical protein
MGECCGGDGGLFCFGWCDLTFGEVDVKGGGGGGRCSESFRASIVGLAKVLSEGADRYGLYLSFF